MDKKVMNIQSAIRNLRTASQIVEYILQNNDGEIAKDFPQLMAIHSGIICELGSLTEEQELDQMWQTLPYPNTKVNANIYNK